jgi:Tol biopolymer transport system component
MNRVNSKYSIIGLLFVISLLLTGCSPQPGYGIVFRTDINSFGNYQIYRWESRERKIKQLTFLSETNDGKDQDGLFYLPKDVFTISGISRDGKTILFDSLHGFYLLNENGSFQQIERMNLFDESAQFSPDGKYIAFKSGSQRSQFIYVMGLTAPSLVQITLAPGGTIFWSNDSKYLAYSESSSQEGGQTDIYFSRISFLNTQTLLTNNETMGDCIRGAWSPDDKSIAVECADIYLVKVQTKEAINLTENQKDLNCGGPVWSPDGKWIAFRCRDSSKGLRFYRVHPDGSGFEKIPILFDDQIEIVVGPYYTPDGKQIIYSAGKYGKQNIYVANVDGTSTVSITDRAADYRDIKVYALP